MVLTVMEVVNNEDYGDRNANDGGNDDSWY